MKKTRKILSIVLAVLFAFSSMPVVYTGTAAADAVGYALGETGTLENPTRPVDATGSFAFDDLVKITIEFFNTDYTFYQSKDDEHFALTQSFFLQKVNANNLTVQFESVGFWEQKTSDMTDPNATTLEWRGNEDDGLWEIPVVKDNRTDLFIKNHNVSNSWNPTSSASQALTGMPFVLTESSKYAWDYDVVFKGNSGDDVGEHNINFYQQLKWRWDANDGSDFAKVDIRHQTRIRILDAREFVKELAKLQNIVDNPEDYTAAYVSSAQAILNDIPDDLENLTAVYDQSVIDAYVDDMKALSLNSADYTEYNRLYSSLSAISNAKGAYTDKSYQAFVTEITTINAGLSKSLDKTQQAIVDAATQKLRDAYGKLVSTDLGDSDTPYSFDSGDGKNIVIDIDNTAFFFMQTKDDQEFSYQQNVLVYRTGGSTAREFRGLIIDETGYHGNSECVNSSVSAAGSANFLKHLDSSCYAATSDYKDEKDSSVSAKEFTCVTETQNSNWRNDQEFDTNFVTSNGRFGYNKTLTDYGVFGSGPFEYRSAVITPVFRGNANGTYGELNLSYALRAGFSTNSGLGYSAKQWHTHIPTTIEVTDVRQLISAVNKANGIIADADNYSDSYIANLKAAVTGIPVEMLRGVEYYTQAEVDALYNQVNGVLTKGENAEGLADYSEYARVLEQMMSVDNQDKYTEESYIAFTDAVFLINKNLDKSLPASEQAKVDAAVEALYAAYAQLEFYEVGDDNTFSSDDITDDLGFNTLYFEVSNTEYTFMQTYDGQKFALETELYLESTKENYDTFIYGLQYSMVKAGDNTCAIRENPDVGCHNLENIVVPEGVKFTDGFLDTVTEGVEKAAKNADGSYVLASDGTGTIGHNTTWIFDEERSIGSSFINNGLINYSATIDTAPHYATSNIVFAPVRNNPDETEDFEAIYSWRLGWGYREEHVLDSLVNLSTTSNRHVHIPVSVKLTDARALNSLYNEVGDILSGKTDKNYTYNSLVKLYEAYNEADADMANGNVYHTQAEVNEEYAKLKAAFDELQEGADYSEYFKAYVKAEEIINSNNADSKGNVLYEEDEFNTFVENVTNIGNGLDKNLTASEENQKKVDTATQGILDAISKLEESKLADYSRLNDAMTEAEKVLTEESANPGTYTQETLDAIQNAYNNALQNAFNNDPEIPHKELHADQQATIDAAASALEAAIADKEYKADYSEFEEAYDKVQDIVNNSDKYPDETVQAAKDALNEADKLDKDLPDTADNREEINNATDKLNEFINSLEPRANYDLYYEYLEIANSLKPSDYTGYSYGTFMKAVEEIDAGLAKNLPQSQQAIVDKAVQDLLDAYNILVSNPDTPNVNGDKVFTEADIAGEYNGAFKFSLASTEYKFVQTVNDEKLKVQTDIVVSNADTTNYTINLESLKMSSLDGNELASMDTTGNCFNSDSVTVNDSEALFCEPNIIHNVVTGVVMYPADTNGDMAHHTTWQNVSGVALSTDGVLNASTTLTEESSASAHYVFASAGGGDTETKTRSYTYVLRLGWSETNNATNETQHYHAHIPVTMSIVDARALFDLYNDLKETVAAGNADGKYTDSSFSALEKALEEANTDIIFGITDATQEQVNEEYEKLKAASDALSEKADYSGLDEAIKDAQDIVNAPDGTYTEETVKNAQDALDAAEALDKDLPKSEQETVDKVIQDLIDSVINADEKADYSGLDEALEDAKEIVNNPDKYTEETVKNAQDAIDAAEALDKDLPKSEQETVDKVIQDLIDSATNAKEKADYSGLDEALEDAKEIVNNPDKYTEETVKNAQDAIDAAENLNKDLEKNDENQAIIDGVIQDLIDSVTNAKEKADYTDYNNAKADADNLVNDDGNGNPIYDEEAFQQYKDAVEKLDSELNKDLPKEDQEIVDKATEELKDLRTELDASKGSEQEIIDPETKADSIKDKVIEEGGYNPDEVIVEFKNYLGEELAGEAFVGTGSTMRVILKSTGELLEYKLFIVMGDVDGDGDVDNDDYQKSMRIGLKKEAYTEQQNYFFIANDMSGDGYIDVIDCALIRRTF